MIFHLSIAAPIILSFMFSFFTKIQSSNETIAKSHVANGTDICLSSMHEVINKLIEARGVK